jgi:hypothetical protein
MQSPIAQLASQLYPLPNIGTNVFESTQLGSTNYDQGGFRSGSLLRRRRPALRAVLHIVAEPVRPAAHRRRRRPRFSGHRRIVTNSATASWVHLISPQTVQTARASFLRNVFDNGQAVNHTPGSSLGFQYQPTLGIERRRSLSDRERLRIARVIRLPGRRTPIRTTTRDLTRRHDARPAQSQVRRRSHSRADQRSCFGIATNGFFVFAPFPASDSFASFLLGQSVQFFQGGGDFNRGLRKWVGAGYAQDEFRISRA